MARRGDRLREHILWTAKDVFLELGFERTSMDVLAARAETSKRTLYAHFDNKDTLFLAVVGFIRGLHLARLRTPEEYGDDRIEAVTRYCVRFLQSLVWIQSVRTCRLVVAEAARVPQAAADYYDALFGTTRRNLAAYLGAEWSLPDAEAFAAVDDILGRAVYPRFTAVLFGVAEAPAEWPDDLPGPTDPDYRRIHRIVTATLDAG
ncbi:TetR/AcrR family transcriptional regulator [Nocardia veterana]|uniref:TetR/AcrR family transcriptional regulator n=1 Tax=Nocardia veterana TaxID=132249 RepID=A0A7X6RJC6_9NOCA|nr:TetR/AcrR family transcriptional regulator [Nocardia veterana]NKY87439.1 TetR/AcrR family transcriptional regulator [Nocardia veterana]